jgi:DNA-binding LacI/PurR family transcriptional regulator
VSEATRARILAIAQEVGWQPNSAARVTRDLLSGTTGPSAISPARPDDTDSRPTAST